MITDADRYALRYIKGQSRGLARVEMTATQKAALDELLAAFLGNVKYAQVGRELDRLGRRTSPPPASAAEERSPADPLCDDASTASPRTREVPRGARNPP